MFNKILVLAPHTDDGELGCGGTIAKYVEQGLEVYCVAFSIAEESVPEGFHKEVLAGEYLQAMSVLGLKNEQIINLRFPVRKFPEYRQEILEALIKLRDQLKPDLVLLPSPSDIHQDHQIIAAEGLRAFKNISILGYELPWNNVFFTTRCFVKLEKKHIQMKIEALNCYETQRGRNYLNSEFIFGLAKTRGTQIQNEYAEAFEVVRWVIN